LPNSRQINSWIIALFQHALRKPAASGSASIKVGQLLALRGRQPGWSPPFQFGFKPATLRSSTV